MYLLKYITEKKNQGINNKMQTFQSNILDDL